MLNMKNRPSRARRRKRLNSPRHSAIVEQISPRENLRNRPGINSLARKKRREKLMETLEEDKQSRTSSGTFILPTKEAPAPTSEKNIETPKTITSNRSDGWSASPMGKKSENMRVTRDGVDPEQRKKNFGTPEYSRDSSSSSRTPDDYRMHSKNDDKSKSDRSPRFSHPSLEVVRTSVVSTSELMSTWSPMRDASFHVKILATLIPDEILNDFYRPSPRYLNSVILLGDVSGFTELCEKYDKTGKGGPSRLTEVLNDYLGSMVQIVLSRNGDVCKFGGDAILCFWKTTADINMMQITHMAIDSAIDIQRNCGLHKTDVGVELRVKVAVSAGETLFSIIGNEFRKYYLLVGQPVLDARAAEKMCGPGEVVVSPKAWKYVGNALLYSYTRHSDGQHVKVYDFGPLWNSMKPKIQKSKDPTKNSRSALKSAVALKIESIRPFILSPVMKGIDNKEPLEYLTEMRQVAIIFLNLVFEDCPYEGLISSIDKAYQTVCELVDKMDGAVNKVTIFDKDVAILVVFGLRGFKHEFASQIALKCAFNSIQQLKYLNKLQSASAGVTTGMTYCGVVGHILRREYTVMGLPVNKAARLMCAYIGIVSCDRDTFLHSKLESGHFELLEQKHLKGIQNSGPIYEFNMTIRRQKVTVDLTSYPLLGRSEEIILFENFLRKSQKNKRNPHFMVMYGNARIGKSRLAAKFISIVEKQNAAAGNSISNIYSKSKMGKDVGEQISHIEICFIPLTEDDFKSSYSTIRLMFQPALGLQETSTIEEREDKILRKLGEMKDICFLATLNPIFNVNFDLMAEYISMTPDEQQSMQKAMKKRLFVKCFPKYSRWLVVIEDAEFIDEESWPLLQLCIGDSTNVACLLTIGQRKTLSAMAETILNNLTQEKIELAEMDKWFHAGLACQILGVRAIPVELENLLQTYKSSGNPGWLESYLLTLIQSNSIKVSYLTRHEIKNLKLVTPPGDMLVVNPDVDRDKFDSSNWSSCFGNFEECDQKDAEILPVCVLGSNFSSSFNEETDLTMNMMYVRTIDTLKPLEQLILKVGSALGYNFKRDALKYVIAQDMTVIEKSFGRAIKNLFETRILGCAKGNLTSPTSLVPSRRMILNTYLRQDVKCECIGLVKIAECQNLPDYASCSFLRFRSPVFKDTVYNLLLDEQKKKYHNNSIEFLRNNTYKCKSCGSILFEMIFGHQQLHNQIELMCTTTPMHGVRSTRIDSTKNFLTLSVMRQLMSCCRGRSQTSKILARENSFTYDISSYPHINFSDCQCPQILSSVYSVLIDHAEGAGRKDIVLEIQLEYASLTLTTYNIPLTMQILEEALALVNFMRKESIYPEFCTPYILGKIHTLMGATRLSMGRPDTSLELLETALKYLGSPFPKHLPKVKFCIKMESHKSKLFTEYFPNNCIGKSTGKKAALSDLKAECLGLIYSVHMYMQNWLLAKLSSVWALNKALESNKNLYGLCMAYTNRIELAYRENDMATCSKMELCAIDVCMKCGKNILEAYELEAIARLYGVIFQARHIRAQIEDAISIGFKSIRIAATIRNTSMRFGLMPDLIYALIQANRLSEAVSLLQELEFASRQDSDKSSRTWYHAICLDFQLDTGFTVIPFKACEEFLKEQEESLIVVRDPNAEYRLYTSLWLWFIRNEDWEGSKHYAKVIKSQEVKRVAEAAPCNVFTRLKRLEGLLISLVHKIEHRNIRSIADIYTDINILMKKLDKQVKVVKLFKPRYLLLKAYYRQIKYHDESSLKILSRAKALADKMKDKNTSDWIIHSRLVWTNAISPVQRDYWREHCRYDNLMDWHEADSNVRSEAVMFSLPVPRYS